MIVKKEHKEKAEVIFRDTGIKIMPGGARDEENGHRDLGAAIGSSSTKVEELTAELEKLTEIANTQPHAAHADYASARRTFGASRACTQEQIHSNASRRS